MSSSSINSSKGKGVLLPEVVQKLNEFAPPSLAESWDNVGLLLEPSSPHMIKHLFLTNDLTEGVLEEAVEKGANMVLAYHPPIFTGIKRITQKKWKDRLIVKCLENRIAIYSPHTSYDNVKGGVNDWLISCFDRTSIRPAIPSQDAEEGTGQGRIISLSTPQNLNNIVDAVKSHLGLSHVRLAKAFGIDMVQTIACCAGSGSSVLHGIEADVYLTGEMSHHDVLDAVSNKHNVILCEHSNTERGFLKTLVPILSELFEENVHVSVSQLDKDPLETI